MSKYHSQKVYTEVGTFDSKKEYTRYKELLDMVSKGLINGLKRQVEYELIPSQYIKGKCIERKCVYRADFVYMQDGDIIVEDVKPFDKKKKKFITTPEYKIKKKLLLFRYGIRIKEV